MGPAVPAFGTAAKKAGTAGNPAAKLRRCGGNCVGSHQIGPSRPAIRRMIRRSQDMPGSVQWFLLLPAAAHKSPAVKRTGTGCPVKGLSPVRSALRSFHPVHARLQKRQDAHDDMLPL